MPFVIAGRDFEGHPERLRDGEFGLADIAPTILGLLDISQPKEMTGQGIIENDIQS